MTDSIEELSFPHGKVEPVSTVQSRASFCLETLVGQVIHVVKEEDTAVVQFMEKDFYCWPRKEDVAEVKREYVFYWDFGFMPVPSEDRVLTGK